MNIVKSILAISMLFLYSGATAQLSEQETITKLKSDNLIIDANYSDIQIKTYDGSDIKIKSTVMVNGENRNSALTLKTKNSNEGIYIDAYVEVEDIDKKIIINNQDGNRTFIDLNDKTNFDSNNHSWEGGISIGYDVDAKLQLLIPEEMDVDINTVYGDVNINAKLKALNVMSVYGMIESDLQNIGDMNELNLSSTYDVVDVALPTSINANLSMSSTYGGVYSDLKLGASNSHKQIGCGSYDKYELNNGGVKINLVSTYDNIYVRSKKSL